MTRDLKPPVASIAGGHERLNSIMDFPRIKRLPPYVFNVIGDLCQTARRAGEDVIDFGMGNPDGSTPPHIVNKLVEASAKTANHRYSVSRGIFKLRLAIADWYKRRFGVDLDPDSEAIVTIGSKEGIAHLALAILDHGDVVLAPTPTYPIHQYACVIAGAEVHGVLMREGSDFFDELVSTVKRCWPRPKFIIMNFPHNPTTAVVDLNFMKKVVEFATRQPNHGRARFRLRRPVLRRLPGALLHPGAGRQRRRRGVLHPVQELQHARMAGGIRGRQP